MKKRVLLLFVFSVVLNGFVLANSFNLSMSNCIDNCKSTRDSCYSGCARQKQCQINCSDAYGRCVNACVR